MAYIALPIVAWKRLLETRLDDFGPTRTNLVLAHGDLHPAQVALHPARADFHPAHAENQPKVTLGALFHGFFHVLRGLQ